MEGSTGTGLAGGGERITEISVVEWFTCAHLRFFLKEMIYMHLEKNPGQHKSCRLVSFVVLGGACDISGGRGSGVRGQGSVALPPESFG